jgi:hypothetical protein
MIYFLHGFGSFYSLKNKNKHSSVTPNKKVMTVVPYRKNQGNLWLAYFKKDSPVSGNASTTC